MNRKISMLLIIFAVFLMAGCTQEGGLTLTTTTQAPIIVPATGETETVTLELKDNRFVPDTIEVKGGSVVVINLNSLDSTDHTFTLEAFNRDIKLPAGSQESIQLLANKIGVFEFHCKIHPSMTGMLTVRATS